MKRYYTIRKRGGVALFASLIFIAVFMAMAAGMVSMSSHNAIASGNLQGVNAARSSAESGLEVVRYWMNHVTIPGSVKGADRYDALVGQLYGLLQSASINAWPDGDDLHIGPFDLDQASGRVFTATVSPPVFGTLGDVAITVDGQAGDLSRRLRSGFTFGERPQQVSVFDFGVATKGPLQMIGNTSLDGVTVASESDVYIESLNDNESLLLQGRSQIAGKVSIVNPDGNATLNGGQASIGGDKGQTAIDNHVTTGVAATEFPIPNAKHFQQYATGGDYTGETVLENRVIKANTNPKFAGGTIIRGVLYIESPNVVEFTGNTTIQGVIIGDGDMDDHSGDNQMIFRGTVSSQSVSTLPEDAKYDGLRSETGTFIMAPGFSLSFGGNFGTVNGAIAGNGIEFFGNAGGTVAGSVINYSPEAMTLTGNSDLYFNRSGLEDTPAGFEIVNDWLLYYSPVSYTEVAGCY